MLWPLFDRYCRGQTHENPALLSFCFCCYYLPPTKLREGNVFSRVYLSVNGVVPCDHYPDAFDFTVQFPWPWPPLQTWDLTVQEPPWPQPSNPTPLLVISGGHHWRPYQTCYTPPHTHTHTSMTVCTLFD